MKHILLAVFLLAIGLSCASCAGAATAPGSAVPPDPRLAVLPTATSQKKMPTPLEPTPASNPSAENPPGPSGDIQQAKFYSKTLGRDYHFYIYLPAGYDGSQRRYPAFYLLHGRGDTMAGWAGMVKDFNHLIASKELPPFIAILPDFPSSNQAGYYVDSRYTGSLYPAEPVETAFFKDLIPHIDSTYRTLTGRQSRVVAGYSMGGYGAIRYLLAHPDQFMGAIVMSPAVYTPFPPKDSSAREFGAFGSGAALFDEQEYQSKNYPALLESFSAAKLKSYLFIASGDDEYANPAPAESLNDIDLEAHLLYNRARRVQYLQSELRILEGGHSWDVWRPAFIEGARYLARYLAE